MKLYFSILILFWSLNSLGQNYNFFYKQIHLGMKYSKAGKLDSALYVFEKSFTEIDYVHSVYLKKVLEISYKLEDLSRIERYTNQINSQSKGTNLDLVLKLDSLFSDDQRIRKGKFIKAARVIRNFERKQKHNFNSRRYVKNKTLRDEMKKTDSTNIVSLISLINQHGFIDEKLVGSRYYQVIIILLHFDSDTNQILHPILEKALNEGKISPQQYASIIDRHLHNISGTQKYWLWPDSWKSLSPPINEFEIPEILNQRESIGLIGSSIRQYKKRGYWMIENKIIY